MFLQKLTGHPRCSHRAGGGFSFQGGKIGNRSIKSLWQVDKFLLQANQTWIKPPRADTAPPNQTGSRSQSIYQWICPPGMISALAQRSCCLREVREEAVKWPQRSRSACGPFTGATGCSELVFGAAAGPGALGLSSLSCGVAPLSPAAPLGEGD